MFNNSNRQERIEIAVTLINYLINDTLELWADDPKNQKDYAFGWRAEQEVGNNHGKQFHYADDVTKILVALELNWYLSLSENEDGELTPTIHFF